MANIGSEVERTITWQEKGNAVYSKLAFERSLELFSLTLSANITFPQRKETARVMEAWIDLIAFDNEYNSKPEDFRKYLMQLLILLRLKENKK